MRISPFSSRPARPPAHRRRHRRFPAAGGPVQGSDFQPLERPETLFLLEKSGGGIPPRNRKALMNVLIDGRPLQTYSAYRGIGRYVTHIAEIFGRDDRVGFLFFKEDNVSADVATPVFTSSPRRMITLSDPFFLGKIFSRHGIDMLSLHRVCPARKSREYPHSFNRLRSDAVAVPPVLFPCGTGWFSSGSSNRPETPTSCSRYPPQPHPPCPISFPWKRKRSMC